MLYDIVIIGAGVIGCAVARYLSRYQAKVCVVDKEEDVCCGTSKANSAIVHAGFDAKAGSLMAKMNIQGNQMMQHLAEELDVPFINNGSLVICLKDSDISRLQGLYENGIKNRVPGLEIINGDTLQNMEPNISEDAVAALWAPTGGIICPFELTIGLAENACQNGAEFKLATKVESIERNADGNWQVKTDKGCLKTKYVVNAAGVYADMFHNMVSDNKIHITPRKGEYCLLDHSTAEHVSHTIFQLPDKFGKGVLVSPTVHGNLLLGPTATDINDKEGTNTTRDGIQMLLEKADRAVKNIPKRQVITSFAGLRAHEEGHEFIIAEIDDAPGFVDCAGIESPGLTSAPAIGLFVADYLSEKLSLNERNDFVPTRKGVLDPKKLPREQWLELVHERPEYGQIICRCEKVTEGEIMDAIHRPLGATTLDGVKRRTRAGMGRCQSGFCSPRIMEILSRELNVDQSMITKTGGESRAIVGAIKEWL